MQFTLIFFIGQVLKPMELLGGVFVFLAILIVVGVRARRYYQNKRKRRDDYLETTLLTSKDIDANVDVEEEKKGAIRNVCFFFFFFL